MDDFSLFSITLVLFLIMDPIGNVSSFLTMMKDVPAKRYKLVVIREMLIALAAMFLFNFIGEFIFQYLELSEVSVRLTSGVILFLVAVKILFPAMDSFRSNLPREEPFIVPLAIPLIAGPALLATIMLYAHMDTCAPMMLTGILIAWMAASVTLFLAPVLNRFLGKNGLAACERLMAMVLIMIAIQRFMEGVQQFIHERG